jgi:Raf kinase inhibitor-like YbhB/YbcL family protein
VRRARAYLAAAILASSSALARGEDGEEPRAGGAAAQDPEAAMELVSPAFAPNGEIPVRYTCEGDDLSPPLRWSGVPASARSLALVVDDPDAPDPRAPRRTWVHWVLYGIPPTAPGIDEGAEAEDLPAGARAGKNDWGRTGYGGPCPPIGRHRYFHKLYALDVDLRELRSPTKAELEKAMEGHVLARAELVGTYEKGRR